MLRVYVGTVIEIMFNQTLADTQRCRPRALLSCLHGGRRISTACRGQSLTTSRVAEWLWTASDRGKATCRLCRMSVVATAYCLQLTGGTFLRTLSALGEQHDYPNYRQ